MKIVILLLYFFVFISACSENNLPSIIDNVYYDLIWSDEFDYEGLVDPLSWGYDVGGHGWGNQELQYYTKQDLDNAEVKNGYLYIKAQKEILKIDNNTWGYSSARLVTRGLNEWKYGYFEIRAKLPHGRGSWPAIWMLPTNSIYGDWPSGGEIDIMECVGHNPGIIVGSAHTELYNFKKGTQKNSSIEVSSPFDSFHKYGVKWNSQEICWYVDGTNYFCFQNEGDYKRWPFDQKFHILLNIAIGGSWGGQQGVDDSKFPMEMVIDYVRVYQ